MSLVFRKHGEIKVHLEEDMNTFYDGAVAHYSLLWTKLIVQLNN